MDVATALENCAGPPPDDRRRMAGRLRAGDSLDEILADAPEWLPQGDRLVLSAGASSGKLPEMLDRLSAEQKALAKSRQALLLAAIYPFLLLHFAVLVIPVPALMTISAGEAPQLTIGAYGARVGIGLILLWASLCLLFLVHRKFPHAAHWLARLVPGVGAYLSARALARFASVLDALLESGARYSECVGGAALAVGDHRIAPAVLARIRGLEAGKPLSALMPAMAVFPEEFQQRYETAEGTGQLHSVLPELAQQYRRKAAIRIALLGFWYPKLLFLGIAVMVGLAMVRVYSQYLDTILEMIG